MPPIKKSLVFKLSFIIPVVISLISFLLSPNFFGLGNVFRLPPLPLVLDFFPAMMLLLHIPGGLVIYYVYLSNDSERVQTLKLFLALYFFLFFWPIILAEYYLTFFALVWIISTLLICICLGLQALFVVRYKAFLLVGYGLWTLYLTYVNLGILVLN